MLNPVLSTVQKAMVKEIWNNPSNNDETLVKKFDIAINGAALKKCAGSIWLDDQVRNLIFLFLYFVSSHIFFSYTCMYV
jgi:hypothetical protein